MPEKDGREVERLVIANDRLWTIVIVLLALVAALVGLRAEDLASLVRTIGSAGR